MMSFPSLTRPIAKAIAHLFRMCKNTLAELNEAIASFMLLQLSVNVGCVVAKRNAPSTILGDNFVKLR
ncbi:MAG: hypothetical protein KME32_29185 [Mojavia pulchra JT2-VF2]|uniref:Uncharacterized protein n=1 Tax=Mojavia pulchra JT2-VF2 TaxID=287848 RepID=A0A951UJE6_9NOST|nr:hypothetical protein [Mojavia pulchra JT2-VF2]